MKIRRFILYIARWVSIVLIVFIVAGTHTETVTPRTFGVANFEKVSRSWIVNESQPRQRRAITNSQQYYGAYDKKQKVAPLNNTVVEYKVAQTSFYQTVERYHPALDWFFLLSRNYKIHSQQYA